MAIADGPKEGDRRVGDHQRGCRIHWFVGRRAVGSAGGSRVGLLPCYLRDDKYDMIINVGKLPIYSSLYLFLTLFRLVVVPWRRACCV